MREGSRPSSMPTILEGRTLTAGALRTAAASLLVQALGTTRGDFTTLAYGGLVPPTSCCNRSSLGETIERIKASMPNAPNNVTTLICNRRLAPVVRGQGT